jgi:hypothetical protein
MLAKRAGYRGFYRMVKELEKAGNQQKLLQLLTICVIM